MNITICDDLYLHTVRCAPIVLHPSYNMHVTCATNMLVTPTPIQHACNTHVTGVLHACNWLEHACYMHTFSHRVPTGNTLHATCLLHAIFNWIHADSNMPVTMAYYMHVSCNMQGFRTLFPHVACRFHAGFMQASVMPTCANGCLLHDCYVQEGCMEFACEQACYQVTINYAGVTTHHCTHVRFMHATWQCEHAVCNMHEFMAR